MALHGTHVGEERFGSITSRGSGGGSGDQFGWVGGGQ